MGFFSQFFENWNLKELEKNPIVIENWIDVYYDLYVETTKEISEQFIHNVKVELIQKVISQLAFKNLDIKRNLTTETNYDKNEPKKVKFKLLFIEQKKNDSKLRIKIRNRNVEKDKRTFGFSPLDFYKNRESFAVIELAIVNLIPERPSQLMTYLTYDKNGKNLVQYTDGIQNIQYLLEKRLKLHKINEKFADAVFDGSLRKFIKWIYEKEKDSAYMKKYCTEVKKLLEKHEINF